MKTLDEVIKGLSICDDVECCYACPHSTDYNGCDVDWGYLTNDALHYLKVLQKMQKAQPLEKSEWNELYNQPLTWDELKGMEGKPVWVEVDGKWWGRFWAFVEVGDDSYIDFFQKGQEYPEDLWKCNMGKTWNAFRKERE